MSYLGQKYKKKKHWGHRLRDKACKKNFSEFEKLAHLIQYDLQGFIVKNIESELAQANNQSEE